MDVMWLNTPRVIRIGTDGVSPLSNVRTPTSKDCMLQGTNGFLDQVPR